MTIKFENLEKKLFKNPNFVKEYEKLRPQFELAAALIEARMKAKLSQKEVAKRMGTTQSAVARMEGVSHFPTFKSLQKYAHATNQIISIEIHP